MRPHLCSSKMNAACSHCSGMIEIPKLDQDRRLKLDRTCFPVYGSNLVIPKNNMINSLYETGYTSNQVPLRYLQCFWGSLILQEFLFGTPYSDLILKVADHTLEYCHGMPWNATSYSHWPLGSDEHCYAH